MYDLGLIVKLIDFISFNRTKTDLYIVMFEFTEKSMKVNRCMFDLFVFDMRHL